jgi:hypothetical protein
MRYSITFLCVFICSYRLQLAVRDKLIQKQQAVLAENGLDNKVRTHNILFTIICLLLFFYVSSVLLRLVQSGIVIVHIKMTDKEINESPLYDHYNILHLLFISHHLYRLDIVN